MLRALQIEWMKLKNYRTFWILLVITIICIPAFNYTVFDVMDNSFPKGRAKDMLLGSPFAFPDVWQTVPWNAGMLFLIPAILIITLNSNEFTFRTHRQNVIDGWSRGHFIGVKMIEILLLSILSTIVVFLTTLIFGAWVNKVPEGVSIWKWQGIRFLLFFFVQMISYSMIAFLLTMFIKRAGLSMGIFFIYWIMENATVGFGHGKFKVTWVNYLPQEVTDELIPRPYVKMLNNADQLAAWQNHIPTYLAVAGLYLLLYCLVTSRYFLKRDL